MSNKFMLTTIDNPFNPFEQFNDWFNFDESSGYHSCAYLARVTKSSEALSEDEQNKLVEDAIDEIVMYNPLGVYRKVTADTADTLLLGLER